LFSLNSSSAGHVNRAAFYRKVMIKAGVAAFCICAAILLVFWLPKFNPGKFYLYLNSEAEYRKGNNQSAVTLGEQALSKDQNFLAVYPIVANAYERLGNKDKALKYYFDMNFKSEKLNNKAHLIQAYIKTGMVLSIGWPVC